MFESITADLDEVAEHPRYHVACEVILCGVAASVHIDETGEPTTRAAQWPRATALCMRHFRRLRSWLDEPAFARA